MFSPEQFLKKFDRHLTKYSPGKDPAELYDPIHYILGLGGKRTRPLLTLMAFHLFDEEAEKVLDPALAVETFHNFTLMHDDIMDEAPLRRNKATVHKKWDNNIAILSGDVMLVKAYELLETHGARVLSEFGAAATKVCEGQQLDLLFEKKAIVSKEDYLHMISLKTAALLGFAFKLGGLIAETSDHNIKNLERCGTNAGIAFQLMDDLLDVFGTKKKVGKRTGGDIVANKKTFLLITAFEKAGKKESEELQQMLQEKDEEKKIKEVTRLYQKLDVQKETELLIKDYFQKAVNDLKKVEAPLYKKRVIRDFLTKLMKRDH